MNFDFQQVKPIILQEFDRILDGYPSDLHHIFKEIPPGGDSYARKQYIIENAAEYCPVYLFEHFPFAFEIDMGKPRDICFSGVGNQCYDNSNVDFSPLHGFRQLLSSYNLGSFNDYTDYLHNTIDHDKLLSVGFRGIYEECLRFNQNETDPAKRKYRELIMTCCRCVERIGLRFKALAREMLQTAADEDVTYNLLRIIQSPNTPWEPAVTMFDALNSILCTCQCICGLDGVEMNSYGHIDRLIEPFYQRDLAAGRITQEEAYFLLQCFLCKTDLHCHFNEKRKTYDNGVTVMIGGCDFDGVPVYNSITDMVLQSYAENRLINPKLNARASSQSPLAYLEKLTLLLQSGNNNLVIENDDYIIPMFQRMGVSLKDARSYVGNGCQEVICPNQLHSRAFVYLNMVQVLLDTMQYTKENLPEGLYKIYQYGSFEKRSFDDLFTSFLSNLRSYIKVIAAEFAPYESIHQQINPEPMLSAFNADCIGRGCDIADGGALYCHKTLSLVGFGTLCDSLLSLRRSYQSGTEHILFSAIASDFQEYETLRESLLSCEDRFGHSEDADTFAGYLAHALAKISHGITNAQGIEWHTSLFTYYMFSSFGKRTGATPDGRHGGAPLSRQMNMASLPVLTAAANSMSVLAEANFHDMGIFDIALPYTASANENVRHALTSYLRVCIDLKLPVLQINIGDVQTLIEERQHKGTHPGLTVRVCGYSALFGELSTDMQDEIIARWHTKSLLNPDKSFIM